MFVDRDKTPDDTELGKAIAKLEGLRVEIFSLWEPLEDRMMDPDGPRLTDEEDDYRSELYGWLAGMDDLHRLAQSIPHLEKKLEEAKNDAQFYLDKVTAITAAHFAKSGDKPPNEALVAMIKEKKKALAKLNDELIELEHLLDRCPHDVPITYFCSVCNELKRKAEETP